MKAALKRLLSKDNAESGKVQAIEPTTPPPTTMVPGYSARNTTYSLATDENFACPGSLFSCDAPGVNHDCTSARGLQHGVSSLTAHINCSSWPGPLRKSKTQIPVAGGGQLFHVASEQQSNDDGPRKAPPPSPVMFRRSLDAPVHVVLEALPNVNHLAESGWTRVLTGNIKSVALIHGALGGASMPSSPPNSVLNTRRRGPSILRRKSSAMGYVSGAGVIGGGGVGMGVGGGVDAALMQHTVANQSILPLERGTMTSSLDSVDNADEFKLQYLDDEECGCGFSFLPNVLPPSLLAEADRVGISLQVELGVEVALSPEPPLGRGASGTVFKGTYRGAPCAVKALPLELLLGSGSAELHTFVQEVVVMAPLRHPNIVSVLGASLQPPDVFLLMELCPTSLEGWLHRGTGGCGGCLTPGGLPPSPRQILRVAVDVARGLQYLHERSPAIVHRDLKPANVLIAADGTAKITDFGLARVKTSAAINTKAPEVGSVGYMAPECFTSEHGLLTDKCDTWSLGVLLWEMVARKRPFQGLNLTEYYREVVIRKTRLPIPQDDGQCPLALRRLISSCWCDDPQERPPCAHIVAELTRLLKYCPPDVSH